MANYFKHSFVSAKSDGADATLIRPSNWNANHDIGIQLTNRTGGALSAGDVVTLSSANDESVILGDTLDSVQQYVVAQGTINNLAQGLFTQTGAVQAQVMGATVRGNYVAKHSTTKALYDTGVAAASAGAPLGAVGIALTGTAGAGLATVHLFGQTQGNAVFKQGSSIASAASITIPSGIFYAHVTGTTTIAGIAARPAGTLVALEFESSPTITHSATLILQNGVNLAAFPGDVLLFVSEGGGTWRQLAPTHERLLAVAIGNTGVGLGGGIAARNAAGTADVFLLGLDSSNRIFLGDGVGSANIYVNTQFRCDLASGGRLVIPVGASKWAV